MIKEKALKYLFVLLDYLSSGIAWALFFVFRKIYIEKFPFEYSTQFYLGILIIPLLFLFGYWVLGLYENIYKKYRLQAIFQTFSGSLIGTLIIFFVFILDDSVTIYSDYYVSFIFLFLVHFTLTFIGRIILITLIVKRIHNKTIGFNTLIIGGNKKALQTYKELNDNLKNYGGYLCKGYIKTNGKDNILKKELPELGTMQDIHLVIQNYHIEEIIIAIETTEHSKLQEILNELEGYQFSIKIIPDMYDILSGKVKTNSIFGTPLIEVKTDILPFWQKRIKRLIDVTLSLIGFLILSPAFIILSILVKKGSSGPIFFSQERIGIHGKPFNIYKFRTMYTNAEEAGPQLSSTHDPRITKTGKFLRKTRLDEIPQFYNVLKGDMSFVGPRPERQFFINKIMEKAPHYKHLHKVKPGITSWGQVKYGYAENVDEMIERLKYDILYVKNQSLTLDFKILVYTILIVLKSKGK